MEAKVRCSATYISKVETGNRTPGLIVLASIARALGTTVGELLGEKR